MTQVVGYAKRASSMQDGRDVDNDARFSALEQRLTDSLDAIESRYDLALADMRAAVERAIGGLSKRASDLEASNRQLQVVTKDHDVRLAQGDTLLKEFREFRKDFEAWAKTGSRLFRPNETD